MKLLHSFALLAAVSLIGSPAFAAERLTPVAEAWDYAGPMKKVAANFKGKEGVVLHIGCSMTIANPYGQWARNGKGRTPEDMAILKWMHTGKNDKTDGFWLSRAEIGDHVAYTSTGGMQSSHLLNGGPPTRKNPPLKQMLADYQPRMVVLMVGTYDADEKRPIEDYRKNMAEAVDQIIAAGAIPVLTTLCPLITKNGDRTEFTKGYNIALREIAKERGVPVIDFEREILKLRPTDWNGTIQKKNNIHLSASETGGNSGAEPTPENLSKSGYLLRTWLTVQKIAEVKSRVIDVK